MSCDIAAASELSSTNKKENYVSILACEEIDRFHHNAVFAAEIAAAFADANVKTRTFDYRKQVREVTAAVMDPLCQFFLCFNGFGSELSVSPGTPGHLLSAFEYYRKPIFDLMHDMPSGEPMAHQMNSRSKFRFVLMTDYGYVQEANELGIPNVRFVPSITFPRTVARRQPLLKDRPIQVLLPATILKTDYLRARYDRDQGYRTRVYREIFSAVSERCSQDLSLDSRVETRSACLQAGVEFDVRHPDSRFLLTSISDFVKFERRRNLLKALQSVRVTVVADRQLEETYPGALFETAPARSFTELLGLMTNSQIVLCPLPHMAGFHERALGAFNAGAAVLAAPNHILESNFLHDEDMYVYRDVSELPDLISDLLADPDRLQRLGQHGHSKAMAQFSPSRLIQTILAHWRLYYRDTRTSADAQDDAASAAA